MTGLKLFIHSAYARLEAWYKAATVVNPGPSIDWLSLVRLVLNIGFMLFCVVVAAVHDAECCVTSWIGSSQSTPDGAGFRSLICCW